MGIISSALAAAGDAGVQSMNQNITQQNALDQQQAQADLQLRNQGVSNDQQFQNSLKMLAAQKQAAIDSANQMRQEQSSRINAALPSVVQQKLGDKYAPSDAAVAAADAGQTSAPLTPEQKAVIEQAKGADAAQIAADPEAYVAAAIKTGDIDPHQLAQLVQQQTALKRQEAAQEAQFEHSDASQKAMFEHSDAAQRASQAFQAVENSKSRAAMADRVATKAAANAPPDDLTQGQKDLWLHQYISQNGAVPRSAPAWVKNNIGTWAAEKGITPDDLAKGMAQAKFDAASANTSGHRAGSMAVVEAAIPALASNAVNLSKELGQSNFVPLNKLMQMGDDAISDPTLAAFKVAHQALVSEYQMVISRGGSNVTSLKEAMHVLNSARGPEAYENAAKQVMNEVKINTDAVKKVRGEMGGAENGIKAPTSLGTPNPFSSPGSSGVLTYDPNTGTFH